MASYYSQPPPQPQTSSYNPQQNLQFYPSSYPNAPVSGHTTPSQAQYGNTYGQQSSSYPSYGGYGGASGSMSSGGPSYGGPASAGFGAPSGRMGEQGGLRTGWLAAFGTEGYEGEPPLLEELGVNFGHIRAKVCLSRPHTIQTKVYVSNGLSIQHLRAQAPKTRGCTDRRLINGLDHRP